MKKNDNLEEKKFIKNWNKIVDTPPSKKSWGELILRGLLKSKP